MQAYAILRVLLFSAVLIFPAISVARAEMDPEALKQRIRQRSQNIKEYRALLNDPDQAVRLAALDTMLNSDDLAMRELAFGMCFNSADQAMRSLCLKNRFAGLKTLTVAIGEIENPTPKEKKALSDWAGLYIFEISDFDRKTGHFSGRGKAGAGQGHVAGDRIEFAQHYCNGRFELTEGGILEGYVNCTGSWLGRFPGRIELQ